MRLAKLLAGVGLALLVHLVGTRLLPGFSRWVDVFLVAVVLHALNAAGLPIPPSPSTGDDPLQQRPGGREPQDQRNS